VRQKVLKLRAYLLDHRDYEELRLSIKQPGDRSRRFGRSVHARDVIAAANFNDSVGET